MNSNGKQSNVAVFDLTMWRAEFKAWADAVLQQAAADLPGILERTAPEKHADAINAYFATFRRQAEGML